MAGIDWAKQHRETAKRLEEERLQGAAGAGGKGPDPGIAREARSRLNQTVVPEEKATGLDWLMGKGLKSKKKEEVKAIFDEK